MSATFLSAENLSQSYGEKLLFQGIDFSLREGQKIALVGVNGCGKSTLLRILAGKLLPDKGEVHRHQSIRLSFLAQEPDMDPELSVMEVLFAADSPELEAVRKYQYLSAIDKPDESQLKQLNHTIETLDQLNAWDHEVRIKQILSKLNVDFFDKKISELSGGQCKRVAIARALIEAPELLIMDEPTNHLDMQSIQWLEKQLSTSKQSLIMVTHDRYFLNRVTNEIVEMDQGKLHNYKGNYEDFLIKKAERERTQEQEADKASRLLKNELEWFRRSPKARTTKSKSRIDKIDGIKDKAGYKKEERTLNLKIGEQRLGTKILELEYLSKAFDEQVILKDFSYIFKRGERLGIAGTNGAGKTTFLNMITGGIQADSGKISKGGTVSYGYYKQEGLIFKSGQKVIDVVREAAEAITLNDGHVADAAQFLEFFMFPRFMHHARVSTLSGGERRRLHLLRVLVTQPNFLILDEPTNDLDLVTLRQLEEYLLAFGGCLIIVSHDRYFLDRLVDHMFVFEGNGKIKDFPGNFSQYLDWKAKQDRSETRAKKEDKPKKEAPKDRKRKLGFNEKRELEELEAAIPELEEKQATIEQQLASGETDYSKLNEWVAELDTIKSELEQKSDRWLELSEIAEG